MTETEQPFDVHKLAALVVPHLADPNGEPWHLPAPHVDGHTESYATVHRGPARAMANDERCPGLRFMHDWPNRSRLRISCVWPQTSDRRDFRPHFDGGRAYRITVDAKRPPEKIAADISRRLLPLYLPEWERALAQVLAVEATENAASRLALEIAARLGTTTRGKVASSGWVMDAPGQGCEVVFKVSQAGAVTVSVGIPDDHARRNELALVLADSLMAWRQPREGER